MMNMNTAWRTMSTLIALIVALPIIFILLGLVSPSTPAWAHLQATILPKYIINTLLLMLGVGVFSTIFGVLSAWLVTMFRFPGRRFFYWALMLPMAAPAYIIAYIYTELLDASGPVQSFARYLFVLGEDTYIDMPIRSLLGAVLLLSLVLYPYIYLLTRNAFEKRSNTLFEAARSLGASKTRAFFSISLPAARPAIIAGLALVLMETLADFGVVDYFGIPTFSTGIFRTWLSLGEKSAAIKLAAMMFLLVVVLVGLEKMNRRGLSQQIFNRDAKPISLPLNGFKAWLGSAFCFTLVFLGCIVPFLTLLIMACQQTDFSSDNWVYALNTLKVSLLAVSLTCVAALALSFTQRFSRHGSWGRWSGYWNSGIIHIATLGYALPGALLAIALLTPVGFLDRQFARFVAAHFDWQSGLLLSGSIGLLAYAYVVRFLTVAYNTTNGGLAQIATQLDDTARSLGATPLRMIRHIHAPLLKRTIFAAGLLVFVDCVRELPATLLLRPFNYETLATRVYRLASDERLAEASAACLLIVVIGLIPVLLLNRYHGDKQS